ncbi:MAG: hypothetical protein ABJP45_18985 [Cyclobacteriaceae bacterium]
MQPTNGLPTATVDETAAETEAHATADTVNGEETIKPSEQIEKAEKFKAYVDSETEFFKTYYKEVLPKMELKNDVLNEIIKKRPDLFDSIHDLIENYKSKFDLSYERWKKQVHNYGEIYFNNDKDRLHLSMCSSRFTNDDHNELTPFGDSLVGNGELINHHQIGVLDALESQLPNQDMAFREGHEGLISAQIVLLLLHERFVDFCEKWTEGDQKQYLKNDWKCPPIIQFSDSNTGAWASDREIPTIIHVNRSIATKVASSTEDEDVQAAHKTRVTAYAASPHEFGHDVTDAFSNDRLITSLVETLTQKLKVSDDDDELANRNIQIWTSWMHELVADAFGDGILGKLALSGLKQVLSKRLEGRIEPTDLIIENIGWDAEERPYDEHPNSFLRMLISIEIIYQLNQETNPDQWSEWKELEWEDWLSHEQSEGKVDIARNGGEITFHFKDQKNRNNPQLEYYTISKTEIEEIVQVILTTQIDWFPENLVSLEDLIHHLVDNDDITLLVQKFEDLL